jgi:hypothetical protein
MSELPGVHQPRKEDRKMIKDKRKMERKSGKMYAKGV